MWFWRVYRLNSSFDSFDTLQKLILSELENVFDDLADVMAKFNDVVQKTCWTFENEVGLWWFLSLSLKVPDDHTNKKNWPLNTFLAWSFTKKNSSWLLRRSRRVFIMSLFRWGRRSTIINLSTLKTHKSLWVVIWYRKFLNFYCWFFQWNWRYSRYLYDCHKISSIISFCLSQSIQ